MSIQTSIMGIAWRVLQQFGHDPAEFISEDVYRPADPLSHKARVPMAEHYRIVEQVYERVGDEAIGIRAAELTHPSHFGAFGHAWLASPTLLACFRMLERYGRVFYCDFRVSVVEGPRVIRLVYDTAPVTSVPEVVADAQLGVLIKFCRLQAGESFVPLSVAMRRAEPNPRRPWDEFFGVPVLFGAQENCVEIDAGISNQLLTSAHSALFEEHHTALAQDIVAVDAAHIVERVRSAIGQLLPSTRVTEEKVAKIVGMQSRTMHRRLSAEGVTFRALLRDVRMDLAKRYVGDVQYSVTDVAFMLGYSDVSAFSRAFRSWFGQTPSQFRTSS